MILVITGTHEQPFERLVRAADDLSQVGHQVTIQFGTSRAPKHAQGKAMFSNAELNSLVTRATVVVTHGGPGSMWDAFTHNKIPIAVPRRREFGEHVDDHQVSFVRYMARKRRLLAVYEPELELLPTVRDFEELSRTCLIPKVRSHANRAALKRLLDQWIELDTTTRTDETGRES